MKLIKQTSYWKFWVRERFCRLRINSRNVPPICRICDVKFVFEWVCGILVRELLCGVALPFLSFCVSELGDLTGNSVRFLVLSSPPPTTTNVATSFDKKGFKTKVECGNPRKRAATCVVLSVGSIGTWISRGVPKPRYFGDFLVIFWRRHGVVETCKLDSERCIIRSRLRRGSSMRHRKRL